MPGEMEGRTAVVPSQNGREPGNKIKYTNDVLYNDLLLSELPGLVTVYDSVKFAIFNLSLTYFKGLGDMLGTYLHNCM